MPNIVYRPIEPFDFEQVRQLLIETGWAKRIVDQQRFEQMVRNADIAIVALDGTHVVGFGRALCDDVSNGYLSMIAVDPNYRRQGIGTAVVHRIMERAPSITWVLRDGRGSRAFWETLGFVMSEIAMERVRTE